jgi:molybdenum cofactor biosynthesis enzyme MoaA
VSSPVGSFDREIVYLRISVTDHCNCHCIYYRDYYSGSARSDSLDKDELIRPENHLGARLKEKLPDNLAGFAKIYQITGYSTNIGIISAISQYFCDTCNWVRLTATGDLVLCLEQEDTTSLLKALRSWLYYNQTRELILAAIAKKTQKHEFTTDTTNAAAQLNGIFRGVNEATSNRRHYR